MHQTFIDAGQCPQCDEDLQLRGTAVICPRCNTTVGMLKTLPPGPAFSEADAVNAISLLLGEAPVRGEDGRWVAPRTLYQGTSPLHCAAGWLMKWLDDLDRAFERPSLTDLVNS